MFLNNLGYVIVQEFGDIKAVQRLCFVRKHHRNRTHHLDLRIKLGVLFYSYLSVPRIFLDLAEELIAAHHLGKSFFMVLQVDEIAITKLLTPVGEFFWQDMRMGIDFKHGQKTKSCNIGVFGDSAMIRIILSEELRYQVVWKSGSWKEDKK